MRRTILRLLVLGVVAVLSYYFNLADPNSNSNSPPPGTEISETTRTKGTRTNGTQSTGTISSPAHSDAAARIRDAYEREISGFMVETGGVIDRVLSDDNEGDRHQRFILELSNGHTVLIAHNIDLAERVPARAGDSITLYGQFEHNDRGGVLHWTHRAPRRNREGGWIEHKGIRYQ